MNKKLIFHLPDKVRQEFKVNVTKDGETMQSTILRLVQRYNESRKKS